MTACAATQATNLPQNSRLTPPGSRLTQPRYSPDNRINPSPIMSSTTQQDDVFEFTFPITGMSCAACAARIERQLRSVAAIDAATVNFATHTAHVRAQRSVSARELIAAVEAAGYEVPRQCLLLDVREMSCAACVARVQRQLERRAEVLAASVNFATAQAQVHVIDGADVRPITDALTASGYPANVASSAADAQAQRDAASRQEAAQLRRRLIVALVLTAPLWVLEMGAHAWAGFGHWLHANVGTQPLWMLQWALTLAVLLGPAAPIVRQGLKTLRQAAPDMNALIALGTLAAFGYSSVATFAPAWLPTSARHVYFESVATIVALVLLGRWLEHRARARAGAAIAALARLQSHTARVRRGTPGQWRWTEIDAQQLTPGDVLLVRPGEQLPADGIVIEGSSEVNESMLTGESVAVAKSVGDAVTAGTLNHSGALSVEVQRVGANTTLAHIIAMVVQAQGARLPLASLADRVTRWFVPAVMAVAVLTFAAWWLFAGDAGAGFVAAVSVLIVACPCAMGLAVPMAVLVGTGRAATQGVLFRDGAALQRLSEVRTVAFDKTGTLTHGQPQLVAFLTDLAPQHDESATAHDHPNAEALLCAAASVQQRSQHPAARAFVAAAHERGLTLLDVAEFQNHTGLGVQAAVQLTPNTPAHICHIGSADFLAHSHIPVPDAARQRAAALATQGQSVVFIAWAGHFAAIAALADALRPQAQPAIAALHRAGVRTAIISGDAPATVQAIAAELGIAQVSAGVRPEGKVQALEQLRHSGGSLAFVGDGINDAPALAAADVGLAIGTGTDVAREAADVVLLRDDLLALPFTLRLARATLANMRQNLFWAFAYNVALIPVAAGVFHGWGITLRPELAAAAMAASSLLVTANALRLRRAGA